MRDVRLRCLALAAACLLGACGSSPPIRYYTLSELPPESPGGAEPQARAREGARQGTQAGAQERAPEGGQELAIRLDRVTVPGELDRPEIVRRADANRLRISELDRWAAPLDDTIRRVLAADLAARLPPHRMLDLYQPVSGPQPTSLVVDIQDFYGDPSCEVTLRAAWTLKPAQGEPLTATEAVQAPAAGPCPDSLPATMSRALAQLSDRIAVAIIAGRGPS